MSMTLVKFIKVWKGYSPGEVAGFAPEQAEVLETAGVASITDKKTVLAEIKAAGAKGTKGSAPKRQSVPNAEQGPEPESDLDLLDDTDNNADPDPDSDAEGDDEGKP